jgi:hypothetical protein
MLVEKLEEIVGEQSERVITEQDISIVWRDFLEEFSEDIQDHYHQEHSQEDREEEVQLQDHFHGDLEALLQGQLHGEEAIAIATVDDVVEEDVLDLK